MAKIETLSERIVEIEARGSKVLADANEAAERGAVNYLWSKNQQASWSNTK